MGGPLAREHDRELDEVALDLAVPAQDEANRPVVRNRRAPFFLRQRSSTWFIAFAVGWGVLVDLSSYSLVVPVVPFRLEALGYDDIGGKTGWLVAAYAAGLIVSSPVAGWIGAKYKNRQVPLTLGLLFMAGAVIMFMESESFALMVVARILQGFSGTVLWTIGLALLVDSVPEQRLGTVLGYVMVGYSVGQAIGPPVGGVLYERLGYRAPFIFSIVLVAIDLLLRIVMIEKDQALRWIRAGHDIPNFEAPGHLATFSTTSSIPQTSSTTFDTLDVGFEREPAPSRPSTSAKAVEARVPVQLLGLLHMLKSPRALTCFAVTCLNGVVAGGLCDTGLTLWVKQQYGLDSMGAGLVFLGIVVPSFFGAPLAGWISDRYGTKWVMLAGVVLAIPAYPLLLLRGRLPLFVFFLVLIGTALALFGTPVLIDLSIVASDTPSISTAHVFCASNLFYSVGALVGPIIAGQLLSAVGTTRGWLALSILSASLSCLIVPPVFLFVGGQGGWRGSLRPASKPSESTAPPQDTRKETIVEMGMDAKVDKAAGEVNAAANC
ncbi:hypothetical protein JCM8208_006316 [Rhodotorula glutinis]